MKEFGHGMYIDGTTVAECGEEIWNKFRQYVEEKLAGNVGSTGYYSEDGDGCSVALDNENWLMWLGVGSPFAVGEKYTKQNILDILTRHGYIEPSEHNSKESNMKITDVKVGDWISNETMRKLNHKQFLMFDSAFRLGGVQPCSGRPLPQDTRFDYGVWDHGMGSGATFGTIYKSSDYNNELSYEDILSIIGDAQKQQEKYEMFTRDMLKPGMFCKCRDGSVFVVTENGRIVDATGEHAGDGLGCYAAVSVLTLNLTGILGRSEYDVVAISYTLDFASPIWERDTKEEEREKIRQEIAALEDQLVALQLSIQHKKEYLENI